MQKPSLSMGAIIHFTVLFLFLQLSSCDKGKPVTEKDYKWKNSYLKKELILEDSIAIVVLNIPSELDTFFTQVIYSDVSCAHTKRYNFSDSDYPTYLKNSNYELFYLLEPDTAYELNIYHRYEILTCDQSPLKYTFDEKRLQREVTIKEHMISRDGRMFKWLNKEIKHINGRDFVVLAFQADWPPQQNQYYPSTYLEATTILDSLYRITFSYRCSAKDCSGFISRMMNSLESLKLEESKKLTLPTTTE
jgi:hypothetical protein